jgi:hypothetical protein
MNSNKIDFGLFDKLFQSDTVGIRILNKTYGSLLLERKFTNNHSKSKIIRVEPCECHEEIFESLSKEDYSYLQISNCWGSYIEKYMLDTLFGLTKPIQASYFTIEPIRNFKILNNKKLPEAQLDKNENNNNYSDI